MGATKRRTIWMPDDEWAALVDFAKRNGRTVSTVIRDSWGPPDGYLPADAEHNAFKADRLALGADPHFGVPDTVLGDVDTGPFQYGTINTRPFTPVPKTRSK
jgi:hypothetical protein